jgi:hypothetical protein
MTAHTPAFNMEVPMPKPTSCSDVSEGVASSSELDEFQASNSNFDKKFDPASKLGKSIYVKSGESDLMFSENETIAAIVGEFDGRQTKLHKIQRA